MPESGVNGELKDTECSRCDSAQPEHAPLRADTAVE